MKLRKTKNKILWLSRQSDDKSQDMLMLEKAIGKSSPDTVQVFRLYRLKDESSVTLSYIFRILGDMWELASARVVIVDTYSIPVSCLKHKKELETVQIWHALGAVKKFGFQSLGKAFGRSKNVAKAMHMHENYDYVFAPSESVAEFYCEAFGCGKEKIRVLSLPRVDVLLDGENRRAEFLALNPEYNDKKIVAYIPTFRLGDEKYAEDIYSAFKEQSAFRIVVSAHPLSKTYENGKYKINGDFSSAELMKLSDAVITDYSACAFEAAIIGKPLYFYVPDYDSYKEAQGLNIDIEGELSPLCFRDAGLLVGAVSDEKYDFGMLSRFCDKYVENKSHDSTERMAEFICSLL